MQHAGAEKRNKQNEAETGGAQKGEQAKKKKKKKKTEKEAHAVKRRGGTGTKV